MIPICTPPGTFVVCIDDRISILRLGALYEVDRITPGFVYADGRDGHGVILKNVPPPDGMIAYNRARFRPATLPASLTRLLAPKPYGERPDMA